MLPRPPNRVPHRIKTTSFFFLNLPAELEPEIPKVSLPYLWIHRPIAPVPSFRQCIVQDSGDDSETHPPLESAGPPEMAAPTGKASTVAEPASCTLTGNGL